MIHYLNKNMVNPLDYIADMILNGAVALCTFNKTKDARAIIRRAPWYSSTKEILRFIVTVGFFFIVIKTFIMQPFLVQQQSMQPTIEPYDYIIVDRFTYQFLREPTRGEVIVFRSKEDDRYLIKRIIGLPGERILVENNTTTVFNIENKNGMKLNEAYVKNVAVNTKVDKTLGEKEYFVMGDNRPASLDSRMIGAVTREQITGRTFLRLFPFTNISLFPGLALYK